jgi:hypothetical protein
MLRQTRFSVRDKRWKVEQVSTVSARMANEFSSVVSKAPRVLGTRYRKDEVEGKQGGKQQYHSH